MKTFIIAVFLTAILSFSSDGIGAKMFPRGIFLNNPGNLIHTKDHWHGTARLQNDKKFVRFLTPHDGVRAMMKTLLTYEDLYHTTTIRLIIARYAPPEENNTEAYISDVSNRMGVQSNLFINLDNIDTLIDLSKAIVIHENGIPPDNMPEYWYEEVIYHDAAVSALDLQ